MLAQLLSVYLGKLIYKEHERLPCNVLNSTELPRKTMLQKIRSIRDHHVSSPAPWKAVEPFVHARMLLQLSTNLWSLHQEISHTRLVLKQCHCHSTTLLAEDEASLWPLTTSSDVK